MLERCPHCDLNVMFITDICPSCQADRKAPVDPAAKAKRITQTHQEKGATNSVSNERFQVYIDGLKGLVVIVAFTWIFLAKGPLVHDNFLSGIVGPIYLVILTVASFLRSGDDDVLTAHLAWENTWGAGSSEYRTGFVVSLVTIFFSMQYVGALLAVVRAMFDAGHQAEEVGPEVCSHQGCTRLRIKNSVMCYQHHIEMLRNANSK